MKIICFLVIIAFSQIFGSTFPVTKLDKAVINVLDSINPISIRDSIEFGGNVYYSPTKGIIVTPPQTDSLPHNILIIPDTILPSLGYVKVANYHTHAASNKDYLDETFSSLDTTKTYFKEYLATPLGKILKYDPRIGRMLIFNRKEDVWEYYYFSPLLGEDDSIPESN